MAGKYGRKVLVTGGGGFLGYAIAKLLSERGDSVTGFSRRFYPELEPFNAEQILGDISDRRAVINACRGKEIVFHTAAKPGVWGNCKEYYRTNVEGTINVIEGCRKHDVSYLIHTSSPSVVFDGNDMEGADESVPYPKVFHAHYPQTKAIAEQHVLKASMSGLKTIILRPHLIWGPRDNHLVPRIIERAKRLRIVGNGKNMVDTIYIDNAAYAHILAADSLEINDALSGKIYFISQGEPVYLWTMVNNILKAGGLTPVTRTVNLRIAALVGAFLESLYGMLNIKSEPPMTNFVAKELATSHWFDITAAKRDLGYKPLVSTEEGLKHLEKWLKNDFVKGKQR
ncbi:MAG: NAD-dependent epimerase/dehydratase family protein [Desulfobacteraceae bacterium]|nr:MAG: NAD-dependent epimerase/dehydratase family protein [Desulfobacteraceae bacterium]